MRSFSPSVKYNIFSPLGMRHFIFVEYTLKTLHTRLPPASNAVLLYAEFDTSQGEAVLLYAWSSPRCRVEKKQLKNNMKTQHCTGDAFFIERGSNKRPFVCNDGALKKRAAGGRGWYLKDDWLLLCTTVASREHCSSGGRLDINPPRDSELFPLITPNTR